jgi:hypothetical protein
MYSIKDLERKTETKVLNLNDVKKYKEIIKNTIKYLKHNKNQIIRELATISSDETGTKYFRFGNVMNLEEKDSCVIEIRISE